MKRFTILILIILTLFFNFINTSSNAASPYTKKQLSVVANDGFNLKATLTYPNDKKKNNFSTVVLLHSIGSNSQWWGTLPDKLLSNGYAVLAIDFRGHGASVYNAKLNKVSWTSLTNKAYAKYPDDVIKVVEHIKTEFPKKTFFDNYAIVGSDIGGSSGILAAEKLKEKPKTIVLLSPVVKSKNLYTPVAIAELDTVDFLAISSESDALSQTSTKYLKKFAQKEFAIYNTTTNSSGMLLLKNNPEISSVITEWIKEYLK